MQKRHKFGDDAFQFVSDIYLVAVELHAVFLEVELVFDLREVEHAGEVERVIDIQMDLEERVFEIHRVEFVVELLVVFVVQCGRRLLPNGVGVVDDVGNLNLFLFGLFLLFIRVFSIFRFGLGFAPFCLVAAADGDGQETAVLAQQAGDFAFVEELFSLFGNVQHDFRAAFLFVKVFHGELGGAVATPFHGFGIGV